MFGGVLIALVEALVVIALVSTAAAKSVGALLVVLLLASLVRWHWPQSESSRRPPGFTKPSSSGV